MRLLLLLLAALGPLQAAAKCPRPQPLNATESGWLEIDDSGSKIFFLFYEAHPPSESADRRRSLPITLWLQGGPGCSSLFGALYELGPELVDDCLQPQPNPGAWNRHSALLFIDQPVGVGFSVAGKGRSIPTDELTLAADVYAALQAFFQQRPNLQDRPLVIAGESYGGKYVPSIAHYILSRAAHSNSTRSLGRLRSSGSGGGAAASAANAPPPALQRRPMPRALAAARPLLAQPPLFNLSGLAIGNGLTDPIVQVMAHADTAHFMGYIDRRQRARALQMQLQTVQLISEGRWEEAHSLRTHLLDFIRRPSGVATLLDMRRYEDYDAAKLVDRYLNLPHIQEALGVGPGVVYESCSGAVADALGPDVMRSVRYLFPDLLGAYPVLLYQGMHDAQDGAASSEAWIAQLDWQGGHLFARAQRAIIRAKQVEEGGSGLEAGGSGRVGSGAPVGGRGLQAAPLGGEARLWQPLQQQQQRQAESRSGSGISGSSTRTSSAAGSSSAGASSAAGSRVAAYWKSGGGLTHVVIADAGHMAPRDAPLASRWMLERWLAEEVLLLT